MAWRASLFAPLPLPRMNHVAFALRPVAPALALGLGVTAFSAPTSVLIRVPADMVSPAGLPALLAGWRQSGQVTTVLFLTQGKPEKAGRAAKFESLAVLEFASEAACQTWEQAAASTL